MKQNIKNNLEGLRGLSAILVVVGHILYYSDQLDPTVSLHLVGGYIPSAHLAVLIFFCLSGYVIGLTNQNGLKDRFQVFKYIKKRIVRIYPIYIFSLIVAVSFLHIYHPGFFSLLRFLNNAIFLQSFTPIGYFESNPLWSIGYEMLFYLMFIPISYFNISRTLVFLICILVGVVDVVSGRLYDGVPIYSYCFGFSFWILGLFLSELKLKGDLNQRDKYCLLGFVFLILSYDSRGGVGKMTFPDVVNLFSGEDGIDYIYKAISIFDIMLMPFCAYLVLKFANKQIPYEKFYDFLIYAGMGSIFLLRYIADGAFVVDYIIPGVFYLLSVLFYFKNNLFEKISDVSLGFLINVGGISYGIYALHFPVISFFHVVNGNGSIDDVLVIRLIFYISLVFLLSYFLEKIVQPKIKFIFNA